VLPYGHLERGETTIREHSADIRTADIRTADIRTADIRTADIRTADIRVTPACNTDAERMRGGYATPR
jgi:uncharacterized protein YjbI with pentapeptide repeats